MTVGVWMLFGFAVWTLVLMLSTVGVYRWAFVLFRRAELADFRSDRAQGADWYQRAVRAHVNCVENLPVFGVLVFAVYVSGAGTVATDYMAVAILVARVCQSLVHVAFPQKNGVVFLRFLFFFVQLACFLAMAAAVVEHSFF